MTDNIRNSSHGYDAATLLEFRLFSEQEADEPSWQMGSAQEARRGVNGEGILFLKHYDDPTNKKHFE